MWREQGTFSVELLFVRRSLSCIFSEGTDFLIPLSDFEQCLVEVFLEQPKKMVGREEALKRMEERAKKKKNVKPAPVLETSFLSSPSGRGEKRR